MQFQLCALYKFWSQGHNMTVAVLGKPSTLSPTVTKSKCSGKSGRAGKAFKLLSPSVLTVSINLLVRLCFSPVEFLLVQQPPTHFFSTSLCLAELFDVWVHTHAYVSTYMHTHTHPHALLFKFNPILSDSHFWSFSYFCCYRFQNTFSNNSSKISCFVLITPQPASSTNRENPSFLPCPYSALMWIENRITICKVWLACTAVKCADNTSMECTCQRKISLNRWDIGSLGCFGWYEISMLVFK